MQNDISKYLTQYKDIYDSEIYIEEFLKIDNFFLSSGNPNSNIVFIDQQYSSYTKLDIDKSDELFDKILSSVNLNRKNVYILKAKSLSIKKLNLFEKSIAFHLGINKFRLIVCLGNDVMKIFFENFTSSQNKICKYKNFDIINIHHPLELLKNSKLKIRVWEDLKLIKSKYLNAS